jgi:hypothetical protein
MKKELLMGTALVSTLGAASIAEAVTATMSGNHQTGIEFDSPTGGTDTNAQKMITTLLYHYLKLLMAV